jgi:hypothetical protein
MAMQDITTGEIAFKNYRQFWAKASFVSLPFRHINVTAMNLDIRFFSFIAVWLQPTVKLEIIKGL